MRGILPSLGMRCNTGIATTSGTAVDGTPRLWRSSAPPVSNAPRHTPVPAVSTAPPLPLPAPKSGASYVTPSLCSDLYVHPLSVQKFATIHQQAKAGSAEALLHLPLPALMALRVRPSTYEKRIRLVDRLFKYLRQTRQPLELRGIQGFLLTTDTVPSSQLTYLNALRGGFAQLNISCQPLHTLISAYESLRYTGVFQPTRAAPPLPANILDRIWTCPSLVARAMLLLLWRTGRRANDLLCLRAFRLQSTFLHLKFVGTKSDRLGAPEFLSVSVSPEESDIFSYFPFPVAASNIVTLRGVCKLWGITPKSFRVAVIVRLEGMGVPLTEIALVTGHHDCTVMVSNYLRGKSFQTHKKQLALTKL